MVLSMVLGMILHYKTSVRHVLIRTTLSEYSVETRPVYFYQTTSELVFVVITQLHSDSFSITELVLPDANLSNLLKPYSLFYTTDHLA